MKAAKILREKIAGDSSITGVIVSFHLWPEVIEISMNAGLDYIIIDLEHGAFNDETVAEVCARGRLADFPVLIRPHSNHFDTIRKTLDFGPCGLMLAVVDNTDILDEVRDGIWMPPRGKRRPGGAGNRWLSDFNYETWRDEVEEHFIVLPQIETRVGLENVEAIARHEITTAMAIGPYDLAADLGVCWKPDDENLVAAFGQIRAAARAVGKNMWVIGDGATMIERGFNFLCITEPMALLENALKAAVSGLKEGDESAASSDVPLP